MVAGLSFQPGTIGRQYRMTLVRRRGWVAAMWMDRVVIRLRAIGSMRSSVIPE